jgi:hypothetical protein
MDLDPRKPPRLIRRTPLAYELTPISIEATFTNRFVSEGLDARNSPCMSQSPVADSDPNSNRSPSTLSGEVKGCTHRVPLLEWRAENTQTQYSLDVSFTYAIPHNRLTSFEGQAITRNFTLHADEELSGEVTLRKRRTLNSGWVSREDREFGASFGIERFVRVFEADNPAVSTLFLTEMIGEGKITQNDADLDELDLGDSIRQSALDERHTFNLSSFLTSEISYSGSGDLVIVYDYVFFASAKGENNSVRFAGAPGRNFVIRNRALVLESAVARAELYY